MKIPKLLEVYAPTDSGWMSALRELRCSSNKFFLENKTNERIAPSVSSTFHSNPHPSCNQPTVYWDIVGTFFPRNRVERNMDFVARYSLTQQWLTIEKRARSRASLKWNENLKSAHVMQKERETVWPVTVAHVRHANRSQKWNPFRCCWIHLFGASHWQLVSLQLIDYNRAARINPESSCALYTKIQLMGWLGNCETIHSRYHLLRNHQMIFANFLSANRWPSPKPG